MKELRITIIHDDSNTVKEFQGEEMVKNAAIYLANLAGLVLFEKTNEPAINITSDTITHKVTVGEIKENNLEGIVEAGEEIEIPKSKGVFGKIKDALK